MSQEESGGLEAIGGILDGQGEWFAVARRDDALGVSCFLRLISTLRLTCIGERTHNSAFAVAETSGIQYSLNQLSAEIRENRREQSAEIRELRREQSAEIRENRREQFYCMRWIGAILCALFGAVVGSHQLSDNKFSTLHDNVSSLQHLMSTEIQAESTETAYCQSAPILQFHSLMKSAAICTTALIHMPAPQLPESAFRITEATQTANLTSRPPMAGSVHCLTSVRGDEEVSTLMNQSHLDVFVMHRVFRVTEPALAKSGTNGTQWHSGIVLAYWAEADVFVAMADHHSMSDGKLPINFTVPYLAVVDTVARFAQHLAETHVFLESGRPIMARAALTWAGWVSTSSRMVLSMESSQRHAASSTPFALSQQDVSFSGNMSARFKDLSVAEQHVAKKYKHSDTGVIFTELNVKPVWTAPGVTPKGSSGGPVYSIDHGHMQRSQPYQIAVVAGYAIDVQQAVLAPLWPLLVPIQVMLRALLAIDIALPEKWKNCPLENRELDVRLMTPVNLHHTLLITAHVHETLNKAAVCAKK